MAIKQVFRQKQLDGVNLGAVKEIQVLTEVQHPNVIKVWRVDTSVAAALVSFCIPRLSVI